MDAFKFIRIEPGPEAIKVGIPLPLQDRIGVRQLWFELRPLTKQLASILQQASPHNRPKKPSRIDKYGADMAAGLWPFTGQPIIISSEGYMIDGQNRCEARLKSNAAEDPIVLVLYGLDPAVFPFLDCGMGRTSGDALAVRGIKNHNTFASACSYVVREPNPLNFKRTADQREVLELAKAHPGLEASVTWACVNKLTQSLLGPGLVAYAHYRAGEVDPATRDAFFERFEDGINLQEDSPIRLLRERLLGEKSKRSKTRLKRGEKQALLIKAWNHFRLGNSVKALRWRSTGENGAEPFPTWNGEPLEEPGRKCSVCGGVGHNARTCPENHAGTHAAAE